MKEIVECDLKESKLYADYLRINVLPSVDELLDFRFSVLQKRLEGTFPKEWWDREIKATDFLLNLHNQKSQ